jgi:tetratricopeptide (TPR) repeat protein
MNHTTHGQVSQEWSDPAAETLGTGELTRLGEFVSLLLDLLSSQPFSLPPTVIASVPAKALLTQMSTSPLWLGERIRDLYLQEENPLLVSLQHGRLFWHAIYKAVRILASGQGIREQGQREGWYQEREHPEVPGIRASDIAQAIIDGAFSDGYYAPASTERWPRVLFALALDEQCADAYVICGLLQEKAGQYPLALLAYETAMRLAATTFGGEEALVGRFANNRTEDLWFISGGRRYLRPLNALAALLWKLEEYQLADAHYRALLKLNDNDNQGNRDALLCLLLEAGEDTSLEKALKKYRPRSLEEDGEESVDTAWLYTTACWRYRQWLRVAEKTKRGLARQEANSALQEAFRSNHFVPILLLSPEGLPDLEDLSATFKGDATEAARYVHRALKAWRKTPGALEWLEEIALDKGLLPKDHGKRKRQLSMISIAVMARQEEDL